MGNYSFNKLDKDTGEITGSINMDIRVYPIQEPKGSTKAYASVTIDDAFGIHGMKVIDGQKGLFVAMPQRVFCSFRL